MGKHMISTVFFSMNMGAHVIGAYVFIVAIFSSWISSLDKYVMLFPIWFAVFFFMRENGFKGVLLGSISLECFLRLPFTLRQCLSLMTRCVSWLQQKRQGQFYNQSGSECLLLNVFCALTWIFSYSIPSYCRFSLLIVSQSFMLGIFRFNFFFFD